MLSFNASIAADSVTVALNPACLRCATHFVQQPQPGVPGIPGADTGGGATSNAPRFIADERTNAIVVIATKNVLREVERSAERVGGGSSLDNGRQVEHGKRDHQRISASLLARVRRFS